MALFKVYHGDKDDLPTSVKDQYGYIVVDETASAGTWTDGTSTARTYGLGEWYIDVRPTPSEPGKRYRLAAAQLVDEEGNFYSLDDIVQKIDLADDFIAAVYNSSTSASLLTAEEQGEIQTGLDVASTEDSISKAFYITLIKNSWQIETIEEGGVLVPTGYYINTITFNPALHCGKEGAAVPVPPTIALAQGDSEKLYNLIDHVALNNTKTQLTFWIKDVNYPIIHDSSAPNITLVVTDHR